MDPRFALPSEIVEGASASGNEYGWPIDIFPRSLSRAEAMGYACFGGQFQFRLPDGTCEMYWLNADPSDRNENEPWADFCHRSCGEVLEKFNQIVAQTDFRAEALNWAFLKSRIERGLDLFSTLVFVAYFDRESG